MCLKFKRLDKGKKKLLLFNDFNLYEKYKMSKSVIDNSTMQYKALGTSRAPSYIQFNDVK